MLCAVNLRVLGLMAYWYNYRLCLPPDTPIIFIAKCLYVASNSSVGKTDTAPSEAEHIKYPTASLR